MIALVAGKGLFTTMRQFVCSQSLTLGERIIALTTYKRFCSCMNQNMLFALYSCFEGLIALTMVEDNFNLVQALGIDVDAVIDDAVNIGVDVQTVD